MVLIKEYRVPLAMSVEEYKRAQLYAVAKMSDSESGGSGAGVEIIKNEPFENEKYGKGQYTKKIYHLGTRVPSWVAKIAPSNALRLEEESWNAYPYCRTELHSPFMGDRVKFIIESIHLQDAGTTENAHNLDEATLKKRDVEFVDILEEHKDCEKTDVSTYKSEATGRGPLAADWKENAKEVMCCYKLVTVEFRMFGFQGKMENLMMSYEHDIFLKFHKLVWCLQDEWHPMTFEQVRKYERKVNRQINAKMRELLGDKSEAPVEEEEEEVEEAHEVAAAADEDGKKKKKKKKSKTEGEDDAHAAAAAPEASEGSEAAGEEKEKEKEKKKKKKKTEAE